MATDTTNNTHEAEQDVPAVDPNAAQSPEQATTQQAESGKSRTGLIIGIVALLLAAIVAVVVIVKPFGSAEEKDDFYDSGMTLGSYEGKSEEEIIADLNAKVAENEMSISCAPSIQVDSTTGEAEVRIENIAANHVDQKFTIALEDGTKIYESGGIQPGYFVQSVKLDEVPKPGEYTVVVTFQGYDPTTHNPKGGSAALNVPMTVS